MKVHNSGKFHKYSICGCKVKNFHRFLGPYSFISGPILLKFKLEVVFLQTKTVFKELCTFGPALRPCYTLKMSKILLFSRNNLSIGLSKYVKITALSSLPFPGKIQLLFALFGLLLEGNWARSHIQGSESKFDIACFTNSIPSQLNVKTFVPAIYSFADISDKGHIRKILTQSLEFGCCSRYHALVHKNS